MKPDSWAAGAKASATALHNRATQIREPGVYIGFLEWIIWGLANKMTVLMLFGDAIQDIIGMFAPLAVPDDLRVGWAQALVAVVRCTPGGEVQAASGLHPLVNHFMIGSMVRLRPMKEPPPASAITETTCAKQAARRAGWRLLDTVTQGDCGIDTMAHFMKRPRTAETWLAIRHELADYLEARAQDPM